MIGGLILAGGRSRRFGREKAMARLDDAPMIAHLERVLGAGVDRLAVSAAPDSAAATYAAVRGLACLADDPGDATGPLAGVKAGLRWAQSEGLTWLATSPCDTPRLPLDLVVRLDASKGPGGAVASTAEGVHPLCALWPAAALQRLEALTGHPPIRRLLAEIGAVEVVFEDAHAFANLNTPQDLNRVQACPE